MKSGLTVQIIFYNDPDLYPPIVNGIRLLARAGWEIVVLCRDTKPRWNVSYPDNVKVVRFADRGHRSWQQYFAFVRQIVSYKQKASLVYAHDMHALLPARLVTMRQHVPLVFHCHDYANDPKKLPCGSRMVHRFQKQFARTADAVVVPDAQRADVVARELRLKQEPLIAANAPLMRPLRKGQMLHEILREKGVHLDKIVFRQGRIGAGHSIEATLRSMPYWANPNWGFAIMGVGEPSYVEKLQREARLLGVQQRFIVLPPVSYDRVADFTSGADLGHALYEQIHVNNVYIATASNKIMEYMEAGLPLLVSNTSSLTTLVENYNCGVTADEKVPQAIAEAVNTLLGDSVRAKKMGIAARQAFEKVFCYDRQFVNVLNIFQTLSHK